MPVATEVTASKGQTGGRIVIVALAVAAVVVLCAAILPLAAPLPFLGTWEAGPRAPKITYFPDGTMASENPGPHPLVPTGWTRVRPGQIAVAYRGLRQPVCYEAWRLHPFGLTATVTLNVRGQRLGPRTVHRVIHPFTDWWPGWGG